MDCYRLGAVPIQASLFAPGVPTFWARSESSLFKSCFRVPHIAGTGRAAVGFGNWDPESKGGTCKRILSSVSPQTCSVNRPLYPTTSFARLAFFCDSFYSDGLRALMLCCEVFAYTKRQRSPECAWQPLSWRNLATSPTDL